MRPATWQRDGYTVSTDPDRLDLPAIHAFLSEEAYWSKGIPFETVERAARGSLCFGLYDAGGAQVGYARVITDSATFAYLCDVYVLAAHRGRGLGRWLVRCVLAHPDLQGLRRWLLTTQDAHGVYAALGFVPVPFPERLMTIDHPNRYTSP